MSDQPRVLVVSPDADFSGEVSERLAQAGATVVGRVAALEGDGHPPADIIVIDGRAANRGGARRLGAAAPILVVVGAVAGALTVAPPDGVARMPDDNEDGASDEVEEPLTPRERDVLELVALGLSNHAIAARLGISEHTVKFHLASIFGKLGASTRTEAVQRGLRLGVIAI